MNLSIVILAGGRGSRMKSVIPKWMHIIHTKPILEWILDTCHQLPTQNIFIIVSPQYENYLDSFITKYHFHKIIQMEPLGTGHAIQIFVEKIEYGSNDLIMILNADVPFIKISVLLDMLYEFHCDSMVLGCYLSNPYGYGRIILEDNLIERIIEEKDLATGEQYNLCNMGVYLYRFEKLKSEAAHLTNNNQSNEFYITDLFHSKIKSRVFLLPESQSNYFKGVNTKQELNELEKLVSK